MVHDWSRHEGTSSQSGQWNDNRPLLIRLPGYRSHTHNSPVIVISAFSESVVIECQFTYTLAPVSQPHSPLDDYSAIWLRNNACGRLAGKSLSKESNPRNSRFDGRATWLRHVKRSEGGPGLQQRINAKFPLRTFFLLRLRCNGILLYKRKLWSKILCLPTCDIVTQRSHVAPMLSWQHPTQLRRMSLRLAYARLQLQPQSN